MTADVSLASILANLEAQVAVHQEREAFHAQQEDFHRQQRELHAAELATLAQSLESFRTAAETAMGLASRRTASAPPLPAPDPNPGRKPRLSRMVELVVEKWPVGQAFGTAAVTREVNLRYRERLRRPADPRLVSIQLRRMLAAGQIVSVQKGRPHHEALYARRG
jgi:hypothetical protein